MRLHGRSALVTGGSRGIGRGVALVLAQEGADVAVLYRRDHEAARETVQAIRSLGRRAEAFQADVADVSQVQEAVSKAVAFLGKVDILVNNAGIASRGHTLADTEVEEMHRVMGVHFFGSFYCTKFVLPVMRQQPRGYIFFISSRATQAFAPRHVPYAAAKAALEAMARCLAKEERQYGIRVNVVAPGLVETEMGRRLVRATRGVQDIKELYPHMPFGRVIQPEDIGRLIAFLASSEAELISGQVIYVDGGGS
jgi:NAD(P)-dependent dehydrogenase (short-subunit alcohol dehydrogenase family)